MNIHSRVHAPELTHNQSVQVSDVESEVNGWATYDRVLKIDDAAVQRIAAAHADLLAAAS